MSKKVLISGVCGMIGSHCADIALAYGYEVVGVDNLSGGKKENLNKDVYLYVKDCTDLDAMEEIFHAEKPDYVIHCAAMAAEILSPHIRKHTFEQNIIGTTNVVNCCVNHNVKCLAFTSSIAVYGHNKPPFFEYDDPTPKDSYGLSKFVSELDLKMAKDFFDLNYIVFRPHNVIGTRQNFSDKYRNVAAIFCRQSLAGEPLTVFGDGSQTRAFSPVQYVAEVIVASLGNPISWNKEFNVGSDTPMTVLEIAQMVSDVVGVPLSTKHVEAREEAHHAHSSHERVRSFFPDLTPDDYDLKEVIADMVVEAKSAKLEQPKKFTKIEIAKNLPESWK